MTAITRLPRRVAAALAAGTALLAAACTTSSNGTSPAPANHTTPTPPSSHATASHHAKPPAHNPYTGLGRVPKNPTIAVKIDDTLPGRPQVGIDKADIVYIEAVEGGLTRLAAVFASHLPTVGYVRSTRPSDPDLLLQYGKITEAYSGGAHDSLPRIHRSGITSWDMDAGSPYFYRVNRAESDYINVELNLAKVAERVKSAHPHSIGWTFAKTLHGIPSKKATDIRTVVTGSYDHGTGVEFRYDPKLKKYVRYIDGVRQKAADGKPVATENVIVQYCIVHTHPQDTDIDGNPSQFTITVGKGKVLVFRQGRVVVGTWTRKKLSQGTTLRTAKGKRIPLAPGNTWVVLDRRGIPTHY